LHIGEDRLAILDAFEEALYEANRSQNLTRVPRDEFWVRHVVDSLLPHELVPQGASVLDLGTGAGFPAWPLAWARPDLTVVALDAHGKAITFLEGVPLENLRTVHARAEERPQREEFEVVVGRALAPLPVQLELSAAPCRVGGLVLPYRTPRDERAALRFPADRLGLKLEKLVRRSLPEGMGERLFPIFAKVAKTPPGFPRTWAQIVKDPL
jgi:16S rRNA (guanine527-N7)-methyltransferase